MTGGSRPAVRASDPTARLRQTIHAVQQAVRRQNGEHAPLGAKAARTRRNLMAAATAAFAEKGYTGTSVTDIAERAGVSVATFYQYFADLAGIVAVLAGDRIVQMLDQHVDDWDPRTGRIGLRRLVSAFVTGYLTDPDFYRLWEQACAVDPRVAAIRRQFWAAYKHRIADNLADGVAAGLVRSDLSTGEMARALCYLLERYCYDIAIADPPAEPPSADEVIDLLTSLWADAIRLEEVPIRRSPTRARRRPSRTG